MSQDKNELQERVVFANGIFDLLHPGHIELLKFSKSLGDTLIVGINSDRVTKILKGAERPIHTETHRKAVLENLSCVDEVVIFDDVRPSGVIRELMPHVVVKGSEYSIEDIRKIDKIPDQIEIITCSIVTDEDGTKLSTSRTVEKLKAIDLE